MALIHSKSQTSLQAVFDEHRPLYAAMHGREWKWSDFTDEENFARNALKHMRTPGEDSIEVDLERSAAALLARACDNYLRLGLSATQAMSAFELWLHANVADA